MTEKAEYKNLGGGGCNRKDREENSEGYIGLCLVEKLSLLPQRRGFLLVLSV